MSSGFADTFTALQFFNADIKSTSQIYETCVFNLSIEKKPKLFCGKFRHISRRFNHSRK